MKRPESHERPIESVRAVEVAAPKAASDSKAMMSAAATSRYRLSSLPGRKWRTELIAALMLIAAAGSVRATARVEVLDTYPSGDVVTLRRNQKFYLHLRFTTDQPIRIWSEPYFHGKPARAGSNGSFRYTDSGETLGWFFFVSPDGQVDEVRIKAGDGSIQGTPVLLTYPVHVVASDDPASAGSEPEWVTRLNARAESQQREAYRQVVNTPVSARESWLVSGFMLGVLALGVCGFGMPVWALWRWQGAWRLAAAVPAAMMAFVLLRLIIGTVRDPTSHNLWPFEILMVGLLSVLIMLALILLRRASAVARR